MPWPELGISAESKPNVGKGNEVHVSRRLSEHSRDWVSHRIPTSTQEITDAHKSLGGGTTREKWVQAIDTDSKVLSGCQRQNKRQKTTYVGPSPMEE